MNNPIPTFRDNRDRIVYLLAEYKIPISVTVMAVGVWVAWARPELPTPPRRWVTFSIAWAVLSIPGYGFGRWVVKWVRQLRWTTVYHINAVEDVRQKWMVPPETWDEKKVEGAAPNLVNDKSAFEVREFDWQDGANRLVVSGTWLGEASDSQLVTDRTHMEAIHDYLLDAFEQLQQLRATWSDQSIDLQGDIIESTAKARERGQMIDKTGASDVWDKYVDEVEMDQDPPELSEQIEESADEREEVGTYIDPDAIQNGETSHE